jgi:hypothetical protein
MATLYVAGVDLEATLGFQFTNEGSVLDGSVSVPQELEIASVSGVFLAGPGRVPAREFTFRGYLAGATPAVVRANLKVLKSLLGEGLVTVRVADWSDVMIEAKCVRFQAVNQPPAQLAAPVDIEMTFRAPLPYWRDVAVLPHGFGSTPQPMPQGTGDVAPDLWLYGPATTPVLKGYDARGAELWSATFATLGANDSYRIVTAAFDMRIEKYLASPTAVVDDAVLTAGVFPRAFHATGWAYDLSQWPALSVSTGTGSAVYPRTWR